MEALPARMNTMQITLRSHFVSERAMLNPSMLSAAINENRRCQETEVVAYAQ